ncbi:helix-turn-helix domain-containing protein [Streptococcus mitis]|uniref:helix-turn-helix domain-containing protein n=1 Tax=Streptococcus mitis TaxID=28037 RepID=UPI001932CBD5|nr:helix-turn-helix transcriptional regulator [Streptococcus mitis]
MESNHYGEIVYKIRQDRNMSLKEAAGDAITPNNLSRFEKGLATVKVDTFFELLANLNFDLEDLSNILLIHQADHQKIKAVVFALNNNDLTKAKQILGKKSDWNNILNYYLVKLATIDQVKTLDNITADELEAINYLKEYIISLDTLYAYDLTIITTLLSFKIELFEIGFLEHVEKTIVKALEDSKNKPIDFTHTHSQTAILLVRTYSRYGYYDKAEILIYKLKLFLTQGVPFSSVLLLNLFHLNMYEVYNLLRQNNPKGIELANNVLHYIDAQNNLFPLASMFDKKNTFVKEVQRLNKTGIPFSTEDEE